MFIDDDPVLKFVLVLVAGLSFFWSVFALVDFLLSFGKEGK